MDNLISIIIPIFNGENYLNNTFEYLSKQNYKNFEVILVNDDSNDSSGELCKDICRKDNRFRLIENEVNVGAALSRNIGIKNAKGDYLLILDADDYFKPNLIERACGEIKEHDADLVVFGYEECFVDQTRHSEIISFRNEIVYNPAIKISYLWKARTVAWNKIISKKLIEENNIMFQDISSENDLFFSFACLMQSKKTVFIPDVLVKYYHGNEGSISKKRDNEKSNIVFALEACYEYLEKNKTCYDKNLFLNEVFNTIRDKVRFSSIQKKEYIINQYNNSKILVSEIENSAHAGRLSEVNNRLINSYEKNYAEMFEDRRKVGISFLYNLGDEEIVIFGYGQAGKTIKKYLELYKLINLEHVSFYDCNAKNLVVEEKDKVEGSIKKNLKYIVGFLNNDIDRTESAIKDLRNAGVLQDQVRIVDMYTLSNSEFIKKVWNQYNLKAVNKVKNKVKNINKIVFISYGYNISNTNRPGGGPLGAILMQKKLLGNNLNHIKFEYPCTDVKNTTVYGDVLQAIGAIENGEKISESNTNSLFFCNDVFSAYGVYLTGAPYVFLNHMQGDDISEAMQRGVVFIEDIQQRYQEIEELVIKNAECMIFPSKGAEKYYREALLFKPNYVNKAILYNSIYDFPADKEVENLEIRKDAIKFLSITQLLETKGVDRIPSFLDKYARETGEKIQWILVGKGYLKDNICEQMREICQKNSLIEFTLIENYLSHGQIFYLMKKCDVYVLLHRVSIFDFSTLEAMFNGMHIILSNIPGNDEFNKENNIFLYQENSTIGEVERYIKDEKICEKNLEVYQKNFSKEMFVKRYEETLNNIVEKCEG